MFDTIIKNARILSGGREKFGWIGISQAAIADIGGGECRAACRNAVDAEGMYVSAGFIDSHAHGCAGADFSDASDSSFEKIARFKLSEGTTCVIPTTVCLSFCELKEILCAAKKYSVSNGGGSKMPCAHLEGPFLNAEKSGGMNPEFIRLPDISEVYILNQIFPVGKVTYAPEFDADASFLKSLCAMGIFPSAGHTNATFAEMSFAVNKGLKGLTHFCNRMSELRHREVGAVGAGFLLAGLYIEVIADAVHICSDMLKLIFAHKDISKILLITDSVAEEGMPDGIYPRRGGSNVELKNATVRVEGKPDTISGSVSPINKNLAKLRDITGLPVAELVKCATSNPADALGMKDAGRIERGCRADFAVFDEDFNICKTVIDGEVEYERNST